LFVLSDCFDEEVAKNQAFFIMDNYFRYYYLNTQYVRKGIEPKWTEHLQEYWSDFMSGKKSDEAKE
jgi:hypothetical protein